MDKKIKKGILIGFAIFIIAEAVSFGYAILLMNLVPSGTQMTPPKELLLSTIKIVNWICKPFSNLAWVFGKDLIRKFQYSWLILRMINLFGWTIVSIIILSKSKNKNS
jgi:hypothetical protein